MINILLVEDSKTIQRYMIENINKAEYNIVAIISKGKEAIKYITENDHIDIIILDVNLEDEYSGIDIAAGLMNRIKPGIVFHTSTSNPDFFSTIEQYNPLAYLLKPADKQHIDITLRVAVNNLHLKLENEQKHNSLLAQSNALKSFLQLYEKPLVLLEKSKIEDCNPAFLSFIGVAEKNDIIDQFFYRYLPNYQSDGVHSVVYFEKILLQFDSLIQTNFELLIKKTDSPNLLVNVEMIKIEQKAEKYILVLNPLNENYSEIGNQLLEIKKISAIYNSIRSGILLIDTQSFKIVDGNEYALNFLGCTKAELKRQKLNELFPDNFVTELIAQKKSDGYERIDLKIGEAFYPVFVSHSEMEFLNETFILLSFNKVNVNKIVANVPISHNTDNSELKKVQEENQKHSDSLLYAKRIQSALLPTKEYLAKYMTDFFILWQPKEIVSGDFYWANFKNGHLFFALGDATGHGVPAAFISILGMSYLNEITIDLEKGKASQVLDILRGKVIKSLHQKTEFGEIQDGFDMALLIINQEKMRMQFASANMSVLIIRKNQIVELKGDKMPIGIHPRDDMAFVNHQIRLEKEDMIYLFSDGIIHQFGGDNNKKLHISGLKKVLSEIYTLQMSEQKKELDQFIRNWMKKQEQVDDILVFGMHV